MHFKRYKDAYGHWRWHLKSTNGNIIADSGEGYVNKADCDRGIEIVKGSATAPVYD